MKEEGRHVEITKKKIFETIGVCLDMEKNNGSQDTRSVEGNMSTETQWKIVSHMKSKSTSKEQKRLTKRSREEKTMNKEQEKKKREKKRKVEEENKETSSEVEMEVSTADERQKDDEQPTGSKGIENNMEQENNNNNIVQDREIYKRAKMIMRDGRMLYEDLVVNEGENKIMQETCYKGSHKGSHKGNHKGSHKGEIIVQAKVKDKFKAKSKAYNTVKIAREIYRAKNKV